MEFQRPLHDIVSEASAAHRLGFSPIHALLYALPAPAMPALVLLNASTNDQLVGLQVIDPLIATEPNPLIALLGRPILIPATAACRLRFARDLLPLDAIVQNRIDLHLLLRIKGKEYRIRAIPRHADPVSELRELGLGLA